jgi:hopene-associated glycosyltransferase HpnB
LPSLLAQDYPGPANVVLVDDMSTDATPQLAAALAGTGALPLSVVSGRARPTGWAGKPWAMAQGVEQAMLLRPKPEWLLFTDADITHPPGSLRRLVAAALGDDRAAVSLMAQLRAVTGWERLLLPAFVYFFAQIYPFAWVNDRRRRTAAAAGGCLLVNAAALAAAGGVATVASATIDDVALAKALKGAGYDLWLGLAGGAAPSVRSERAYPRLSDIWEMVARSAYTQLGHSPAALAGTVVGLGSTYLAPPLLAVSGIACRRPLVAAAGLSSWAAMAATYLPIARCYGASPTTALALPFTAALYSAMTIDSARRHYRGGVAWKGRRLSALAEAGLGPLGRAGGWPGLLACPCSPGPAARA